MSTNQKSVNSRQRGRSGYKVLFAFVSIAMLSAVAFVLIKFFEFPLLPSVPWLKMDFSDVAALVGGVFFGPVWAVVIELIKNLLEFMLGGFAIQGGIGNIMNFVVGCAFCVPYSIIIRYYFKGKLSSKFWAIVGASIVSTICMVGLGFIGNYLLGPVYNEMFHMDFTAMFYAIAATTFNPIKCAILVAISALLVTLVIPRIKRAIKFDF